MDTFASLSDVREGPAHLPGVTRMAYAKDGLTIFTGGSDCMMRYHNVRDPNSEPGFFDEHRDPITAVVTTKDHMITGCEDGTTRRFSYPANEFEGNVSRSSGVSVRWLSVDRTGEKVAVCSDDLLVKVINIRDPTQIIVLPGLSRPVRSATWHTTQDMLTIISMDGKIQVFEFLEGNASCLKTIEAMAAPGKPEDEMPCAVAWHPKGDFFVVPTRSHDIAIVDRDSWSRQGMFTTAGHDGEIGLLAWSPNGLYLASSGKDDQVIIWETETRQPVTRIRVPGGLVTALEFSPIDNAISWTCIDGTFSTWIDPVPAEKPHPAHQPRVHGTRLRGLEQGDGLVSLEDDDDDDDQDGNLDLGHGLRDLDNDDWIIDDEDGVNYKDRGASPELGAGVREVVGITKAQPAFQPGSTSFRGKKKYLAFNMIGVIDVTDQESHHVVNVEFHDQSADRRGYHFQDHNRFNMAAIGEQGIIYGSQGSGDLPALIHYKAYDTWASGSDWQVSLPLGEKPVVVAAGGKPSSDDFEADDFGTGTIIVATTKGYIRFFTGSGVQSYLWRMGEEMVSMVAGTEMVFLVHREGGTSLDGCQNLRYTLIDLETFDTCQEGRLPLPKKTTLSWIGFTRSGAPVMFDSDGLLSILDRSRRKGQARWAPLCDTRALAKKDGSNQTRYWPVGVNQTQMMCVILKGNEREPSFPRPIVLDVDTCIPLLNMDITQGQLEEKILKEQMQLDLLRDITADNREVNKTDTSVTHEVNKIEVTQDKELLQLVQAACKADKLQRALDIVRMMNAPRTMEAAAKVAQFYHLPGLQEKIGIIREAAEEKRAQLPRERASGRSSYRYSSTTMTRAESPEFSFASSRLTAPSSALADSARYDVDFAPRMGSSRRTARAGGGGGGIAAPLPVSTHKSMFSSPSTRAAYLDSPDPSIHTSRKESRSPSPGAKRRKRNQEDDDSVEEIGTAMLSNAVPELAVDDTPLPPAAVAEVAAAASKNPFAKRQQQAATGGNPFAKSNAAATTQAKKSYSFFDKVDDVEKTAGKGKQAKEAKKTGGKQTTLSLAPKPRKQSSLSTTLSSSNFDEHIIESSVPTNGTSGKHGPSRSTETTRDVDMDQELEETQVDDPPVVTTNGAEQDEPIEWEDSDHEG